MFSVLIKKHFNMKTEVVRGTPQWRCLTFPRGHALHGDLLKIMNVHNGWMFLSVTTISIVNISSNDSQGILVFKFCSLCNLLF